MQWLQWQSPTCIISRLFLRRSSLSLGFWTWKASNHCPSLNLMSKLTRSPTSIKKIERHGRMRAQAAFLGWCRVLCAQGPSTKERLHYSQTDFSDWRPAKKNSYAFANQHGQSFLCPWVIEGKHSKSCPSSWSQAKFIGLQPRAMLSGRQLSCSQIGSMVVIRDWSLGRTISQQATQVFLADLLEVFMIQQLCSFLLESFVDTAKEHQIVIPHSVPLADLLIFETSCGGHQEHGRELFPPGTGHTFFTQDSSGASIHATWAQFQFLAKLAPPSLRVLVLHFHFQSTPARPLFRRNLIIFGLLAFILEALVRRQLQDIPYDLLILEGLDILNGDMARTYRLVLQQFFLPAGLLLLLFQRFATIENNFRSSSSNPKSANRKITSIERIMLQLLLESLFTSSSALALGRSSTINLLTAAIAAVRHGSWAFFIDAWRMLVKMTSTAKLVFGVFTSR